MSALRYVYGYDPLDRLVSFLPGSGQIKKHFYQSKRVVTHVQGDTCTRLFQYEHQLLAQHDNAQARLLATDLQRCVLSALKDTHLCYSPYGIRSIAGDLDTLPGFNGERPDPLTGHYLLGNGYRAYNPILMRFNSPDRWSPFGAGGVNAYAYCTGDPINRQDRSGHVSLRTLSVVLKAVVRFKSRLKLTLTDLPDVPMRKILSFLDGRDLTSLVLTSKAVGGRVSDNVNSLKYLGARNVSTVDYVQGLRNISMGKAQGQLPSQVNSNKVLRSQAASVPVNDNEPGRSYLQHEYIRGLRARNDQWVSRKVQLIREEKVARKKAIYGSDIHSDTSYDSDDSFN